MALDFPASPSVGQKFPASPIVGVPTYTWDGEKWVTSGAEVIGMYVAKAGDTMTGALTLPADPTALLHAATKQYVDNKPGGFVAGTVMLFYQAAAPTGWTKLTTQNDKALRVVSGSGGVAGGTNPFSTVMAQTVVGNTTLTTAMLAPHTHSTPYVIGHTPGIQWVAFAGGSGATVYYGYSTDSAGGGDPHNHAITMGIQYIDLILASKN